jgi:mono/diheme cytochrome c family protein
MSEVKSQLAVRIMSWMFCAALAGPVAAQNHQYSAEQIQAGYRLYSGRCEVCHGRNGDSIATVNLARQQFPRAVSDDDIARAIKSGNPKGMPPFTLEAGELDGLVAFIRSGLDDGGVTFRMGDAARGKLVYDGQGGCVACHRIAGRGPRTAPDLSDIGYIRLPGQILTTLTDPDKGTMPINRPVTVVM